MNEEAETSWAGPIVLVGLGLLLGAAFVFRPRTCTRPAPSPRVGARGDLESLCSALDEWAIRNGNHYPLSLEVLIEPDERGYTYLRQRRLPKDPWGNEYVYIPPGATHPLVLMSYGADGKTGGSGDDEDLFLAGGI